MKWTLPVVNKNANSYNNCLDILRNVGNIEYVLYAIQSAMAKPIPGKDIIMLEKLIILNNTDLLYRDEFNWMMEKIDEFILLYNSIRPDKQAIANDIRQDISYVLMNQIEQFMVKMKRNILGLWGM